MGCELDDCYCCMPPRSSRWKLHLATGTENSANRLSTWLVQVEANLDGRSGHQTSLPPSKLGGVRVLGRYASGGQMLLPSARGGWHARRMACDAGGDAGRVACDTGWHALRGSMRCRKDAWREARELDNVRIGCWIIVAFHLARRGGSHIWPPGSENSVNLLSTWLDQVEANLDTNQQDNYNRDTIVLTTRMLANFIDRWAMQMEPIYTRENCRFSFPLQWGLTVFWRLEQLQAHWLEALIAALEPDGIRILSHRFLDSKTSQFAIVRNHTSRHKRSSNESKVDSSISSKTNSPSPFRGILQFVRLVRNNVNWLRIMSVVKHGTMSMETLIFNRSLRVFRSSIQALIYRPCERHRMGSIGTTCILFWSIENDGAMQIDRG